MEELGKKAVRAADRMVDYTLIGLLALLFALGCYSLWDSQQVYDRANATQWQPYKPTEPEPLSFWELQRINPEVRAWITVYGTNVDYPICQAPDINKYLTADAMGEYSLSGALFMEPDAAPDFTDFASFVYGHHMEQNVMFGQLTEFSNEEFFVEHRYGNLFVNDENYGLDFFCYLDADAYDKSVYRHVFSGEQDEREYLSLLRSRAVHWRGSAEAKEADRIVLLSTCSSGSTNGRSLLVGRICKETYENPFLEIPNYGTGVDEGWGWLGIPWWCWIILAVFLILLVILLIVWLVRKSRAKSCV